jgi:transcriptional regulator with XRE-family HTH domain
MRRGRPSDEYPREEFLKLVLNRRDFLGLSLAALAELARVNRGTLSQVLRGQRPCGRADRAALIHALGLGSDVQEDFLASPQDALQNPKLILLDPSTSPHPELDRGQLLLICAIYPEALREFINVFRSAGYRRNYVLQADAALRLAWAYFEMGLVTDSLKWVTTSIRLIERHVGAPLAEITDSVRPGSNSSLCTLNEEASHVLSRALHLHCKIFVERIVYNQELQLYAEAERAFTHSLGLDEHLQISAQLGHDLRWKAVFLASGIDPLKKEAANLLSRSREMFPQTSLGAAYLARDRGVVYWLTERFGPARDSLLKSVDSLSSYADARALGPAFCALSKVILQDGGDRRLARRYALVGGVLHPYAFSLSNAREHFQGVSEQGLRRDIDDLLCGNKPFDVLKPVLSRLTDSSPQNVDQRIAKNLFRVIGAEFRLQTASGDARPLQLTR